MSGSSALAVQRTKTASWPETPGSGRALAPSLIRAPLGADLSCGLGVVLAAVTFAGGALPATDPGHPGIVYWAGGLLGALAVVGSLLIHELGHAAAARCVGLRVSRIRLSFARGLDDVDLAGTPRQELIVAAGGLGATLAVAAGAAALHVSLVENPGAGVLATLAALVAMTNVAMLAFNALPGLPLDGGHVMHAMVWAVTQRPATATRWAARAGRGVGDAMLLVGLLGSVFGFVAVATWTAFLGLTIRLRAVD